MTKDEMLAPLRFLLASVDAAIERDYRRLVSRMHPADAARKAREMHELNRGMIINNLAAIECMSMPAPVFIQTSVSVGDGVTVTRVTESNMPTAGQTYTLTNIE